MIQFVCKYHIFVMYFPIEVILSFSFHKKCRNCIPNYVYLDYMGDSIEICEPKEGDRIFFSGALVAIGKRFGKAIGKAAVSGAVSGWVGSWFG